MAKYTTPELAAHLDSNPTSLTRLWKVRRKDGTILGFTNFDQDLLYTDREGDTVTYLARTGFLPSASSKKSDLSVDNSEITAFLDSATIDEADLRAGIYDDCSVKVYVVNWSDLTQQEMIESTGTQGNTKIVNGMFHVELRGLTDKLRTTIGATYGPVCRAVFGSGLNGIDMDSKYLCRFDVTTVRQTGSVDSATDAATIVPAAGLTGAAGWFNDGFIKFTSGVLNNYAFEVKEWDGTTLGLFLPMPVQPAHGDTFYIEPGCNHLLTDCRDKFDNVVNLRAEPFIPGMDQILNYPNAG